MKNTMLKRVATLGVLMITACGSNRDREIITIQHSIDNAHHQLLTAAAEFESLDGFPRSLSPKFKCVDPEDWTSGFFPGSLWLGYELTGDEKLHEQALLFTSRLEGMQHYTGTHDLGFMIFCSYGNQQRIDGDEHSAEVIADAAHSLAQRFNNETGVIRSWDFGEWNYPVIIDNMMNLEMLFWAARRTGDESLREIAVRHADRTIENHFRDDSSSYHVVNYNNDGTVCSRGTFQGYADESAWARGQAWGLYGYTMCFRETGDERYLEQARKIARFIMTHPNTPHDRIPFWDYDAPEGAPRDASAAAVTASALFELSTFTEGAQSKEYFDYARTLLMNLSSDEYLADKDTNGGFILKHCVGHLPANSEIDTPLNYADYYYLEALLRYTHLRGIDTRELFSEIQRRN